MTLNQVQAERNTIKEQLQRIEYAGLIFRWEEKEGLI